MDYLPKKNQMTKCDYVVEQLKEQIVSGGGDFCGKTVIELSIGTCVGVPNGVVAVARGIAVLPDTGLVNQSMILPAM